MKFNNPDIESSYQPSAMGEVLYDAVLEAGAKKIIDFGVLDGYSTVCMAMAAKLTGGKVYGYDLFEDYEYNKPNVDRLKNNFKKYDVEDLIELKKVDFYEWLNNIEDFDVLHLDISNDGDIISSISKATNNKDGLVFFEGGSEERDKQGWMLKHNKKPICDLKDKYTLIHKSTHTEDDRVFYPSISRLNLFSNKTLNLIKYYASESVKALILSDGSEPNDKLFNSINAGLNVVDNLLNREMYDHLEGLGIKKEISIDTDTSKHNLVVINSHNAPFIKESLSKAIESNIDIIFLKKDNSALDLVDLSIWELTEEEECFILEYKPTEYDINKRNLVYNFYELMSGVHDIMGSENIEYFLIKSSCLGAVRNRSHIVYSDCIHIGCSSSQKEKIEHCINKSKYFTYENDNIKLTDNIYIKISFDPDVTARELGNRKIYSYGPIKAYSLEHPISYLKRVFGENVFEELVSHQLSEPIKSPKRLYDCYYNSWSAYTSRFFKKQLATHLKETTEKLSQRGVKWWIDCGTLLGAVRNGRIPLFDDDADIGVFVGQDISTSNSKIDFLTDFNPMIFYAGNLHKDTEQIEEINYMFATKCLTSTEFRGYTKQGVKYISAKDNIVSNAHGVPDLIDKRAVDEKYFDEELDEIVLEGHVFKCPQNPYEYVTQKARYGKESANGDPIRNGKPGGDVLRDDFI
jgi:hypothetical protein